ncbi:FAD-linked oxidase C-terminal domain-containing protein [Nonomuraea sp. NPDC049750]|uniref:FAD-binding and (Fe-S)-binding domain-containing protein n=1 Tax=Nonomuraea sp. NPDC049750 TaxID=3154738 RepID=UPI0033ED5F55
MSLSAPSEHDLAAALKAAGLAEVDVSRRARAEFSSDASIYRVAPAAVAFPRSADEVLAALSVCREAGVPITARGAGTSIAGNAIGTGLVLDFSRHMNRVLGLDPKAGTARVQPGVVLDALQRQAAPHGLRFGPDPSTHSRCTIGGMIGNNACGSRALGYGRTSDNVQGLVMVAGTGERLDLRRGTGPNSSPILRQLQRIVHDNLAVIRTELGRFGRQISGYSLEHLLPERDFDVARSVVGSEGTWGLLLEATVNLVRRPAHQALVALGYADMAAAADAVPALLGHHPVAVEGLDSRIVDVVRERQGAAALPDMPRGGGWLLVEITSDAPQLLPDMARRVVADAAAWDHRVVTDPAETAAIWRIREDGAGIAARPSGGRMAHAGWEDAAVPPQKLGPYLRDFDELLSEHGLRGVPYGHFGDGCVHTRIDFPLDTPDGATAFRAFMESAAALVASYGGSMSGEHGDGRARSELLSTMYSPTALAVFAAVKAVFDPGNLLNPGVLVAPRPIDADLRLPAAAPLDQGLALAFDDDAGDFSRAVHRCTGVGRCRNAEGTASGQVMCPSYMATGNEKDSTRGRARVLQEMANGTLVSGGWRAPEVHEALDLCLSCKGCASDCPTGVDMASYKAEVLHQAYRGRLRPRTHYALGWLPLWARLASRLPRLTNWLMRAPGLARLGKFAAGVDQRRDLPEFAARSFRSWFDQRAVRADGDPVLLWVDTFTEVFSPQVGIAAVRVLEDAGYRVELSPRGLCCGLTWISTGQLDTARRTLGRSVTALARSAAADTPIVALEPSCAAVFRGDAVELLHRTHGAEARSVASATRTLAELLAARPGWQAPDLTGTTVVAQPHCHQHAVMGWDTDRSLLTSAGADVTAVGGCCGLAGNFGAEKGHFDVSVAVAETALLPAVRAATDDTVVLADGFSCRTQLDALAPRAGKHLAELLAERRTEEYNTGH